MFKNLTIKWRLIVILCFLVAFLLGIQLLALFGMNRAIESLRTVHHDRAIPLRQLAHIESLLLHNRLAITAALVMPTRDVIYNNTSTVEKNIEDINKTWNTYTTTTYLTREERALAAKFVVAREKFIAEGLNPAVEALQANEIDEANRLLVEKIRPLYQSVGESIKALSTLQLNETEREYNQGQNRYETNRNILIASIIVALLLAVLIGLVFTRAIFRPLENVVRIARGIAAGNFTQEIEIRSKDEIGQLMQALNEMRDSLVETIVQVRESEAHTSALLNNLIDGVVSVNEQGVIRTFNPAGEHIFGYAEKEIIGQNISLLFPAPEPDQSRHDDYFNRYLEKPEDFGMTREAVGQRKDGTVFPMDIAVVEMRSGDHRMFVGMIRDISERKMAEEQKSHLMAELESANEELKSFAYVVSHDLKAPLRAIGALADWLSTDYKDKLDDEGKEHLRLLVSRVHRMGNLIDGILQYSRVGRVKEALVAVDLSQVVREVTELLSPAANVTISIETPLPTIIAEPTRIQQIFQNLISNAIKYMDKPQCRIRIACSAEGRRWKLGITDNGPGIESRHFEKIFQLFQTLAPRDRIESTGVGLTLVKKIVEMYGGHIWIESTPGEGSTFFFTLPQTVAIVNSK